MKKIFFILFLPFLFLSTIHAQCPESITFYTQENIDNFPMMYPNCTEIGEVKIGDYYTGDISYSITDLTPLSSLQSVQSLTVTHNGALTSLEGLHNITSAGNVNISTNPNLENLNGLRNLQSIDGNLTFFRTGITDLTGMDNLTTVGERVWIVGVSSLLGLDNLLSIGGDLKIDRNLTLMTLDGFDNLNYVVGEVQILNNPELSVCGADWLCNHIANDRPLEIIGSAFGCFTEAEAATSCGLLAPQCPQGTVWLGTQEEVNYFGNLYPNCTMIEGLHIGDFDFTSSTGIHDITDLTPLNQYTAINTLRISHTELTGLDGLEQLQVIGALLLYYNPYLADLDALSNLMVIVEPSSIDIRNNVVLNSLAGLSNLDMSTMDIYSMNITHNTNLSECAIDNICGYLSNYNAPVYDNALGCQSREQILDLCVSGCPPEEDITLTTQQEINDFAAMYPNCTELLGNLYIDGTGNGLTINDLTPLSQITSIAGDFKIRYTNVASLAGLEQLQDANSIDITLNPNLTDITALSGITMLEQGLIISYNKNLTTLDGLNQLTWVGDLIIKNNKKLESLLPLSNLSAIDDFGNNDANLWIQNNDVLTSLEGLDNVSWWQINDLRITSNPQLTTCAVESICNYLGNEEPGYYSHTILNNTGDCTTDVEVEAACGLSAGCPPGDVTLTTQQEINDFATMYPTCTEIQGLLSINGSSAGLTINDLTPLNQITSVADYISIYYTNITSLAGLEQLQSAAGIGITLNPNLTDITALSGITTLPDGLLISYNKNLTTLTGLAQLASIKSLIINNNKKLVSLHALSNLVTIADPGDINAHFWIQNNEILPSLEGLDNIDWSQVDDLRITSNPQLTNCAIESVCNYIENNTHIDDYLIGINAGDCTTHIEVQAACQTLPACPSGDITLTNQQQINDFAVMYPNCNTLEGLYIGSSSGGLTDITDLSPLSFITSAGEISIQRTQVTDLSGLEQLQNVNADMLIVLNPLLSNLNALSNLSAVGGLLSIGYNKELTTLDGLNNLNNVDDLFIKQNNKLASLGALSNLNYAPTIRINNNAILPSLAGLENIAQTPYFAWLSNNPLLSMCSVEPVCNYVSGNSTFNYIYSNAAGCSSKMEIEDICTASPPSDTCDTVPIVETHIFTFDDDLCVDGVGFENNPNITFTDPATPADAVLSDISVDLFFRIKGISCEEDIAIKVTDPAGNVNVFNNLFVACNNVGLYQVSFNIPSASTTGNMDDWLIEFDDTDDQNTGDEYSLRFARLTYTTTTSDGLLVTNQVSDFADFDLYIDGTGFANNDTYTFTDPGTPADATLSDISLELYFKLNGASCENEIAIQITDPAGNTQALTAFMTCIGGTELYYANLDVPSGNTTGSVADWVVEFDDTNDQNADYEYSVRFGRLTYTAEYVECMEMLANENNSYLQQLNSTSTHHVNTSTHQLNNTSTHHVNTSTHQLNNTSIRQHVNTSMKLYPVPANQHLNVEYFSENTNSMNVEVLSNDGKILMQKEEFLQEGINTIQLDIADLPVGYYFIRIYGADEVQTQAFVKITP